MKIRQPLNAYNDKFVGVVHGVKPSTKAIRDKGRESMPNVIMSPSVDPVVPNRLAGVLVPVMDPSKLYTELNNKVTEWEVDGATELLAQKPPLNVRRVIDTDASSQYVLASLFDTTAQIGLLGMFAPDGELQQLRFFSDEGVHATLGEAEDALWWSARTQSPPYFPFAKEVDALGRVVGYSRVLDRYRVPAEKLEGPVR